MLDTSTHIAQEPEGIAGIPADLFNGFRFRVCESEEDATRAIAVRRRVYRDASGYAVAVPDDIDARSWLLLAETDEGQAVGTVRITPRSAGRLECEEYLKLPSRLANRRTIEITRLAILPEFRKTSMNIPAVSIGLFRLTYEFALQVDAHAVVVCSKPERMMTYLLMGFQQTGINVAYTKLNGARHELLWHDFRQADAMVENEMFRRMSLGAGFPQARTPDTVPVLGLAVSDATYRLAVGD